MLMFLGLTSLSKTKLYDLSNNKNNHNSSILESISKTALTVMRGKTAALKVTVSPSNANNKTLKWTTSNKAVATVTSRGVVKGIKKGTATITATATDGSKKKVTCKVTVK